MRSVHLLTRARMWIAVASVVLVLAVTGLLYAWPTLIRGLFLSRLEAMTHRPTHVEAVELNPFTGRVIVRNLRVLEPDGAPFAEVERLEVRVRPLSILRGHLWLQEAVIQGSTVRVVRFADHLNFSDLVGRSEPTGRALDVTVDRFVVTRSTVSLEDRALATPRTWTSEGIEIEAHDLSTPSQDGSAVASSVTAGALVQIEMRNLRLYPIHFEAVVKTTGFDLSLARFYLPPDATMTPERGRADTIVEVVMDAHAGVRAHATGEVQDFALMKRGERDPAVLVPKLGLQVSDFLYRDDRLEIGKFEVAGSASIADKRAGRRRDVSTFRASIAEVTWPITGPGRLDVEASIPGGGSAKLRGSLNAPPAASQLRMKITGADLAPWAQLLPGAASINGVVEADLSVNEPLAPAVPTRVRGSVAVNRLGLRDAQREVLGARRVEAKDLEVHWPSRLALRQLIVSGPRATIERDRTGAFPLRQLLGRRTAAAPDDDSTGPTRAAASTPAPPIAVTVGQIIVQDGAIAWRDDAVTPRVAADFAGLDAKVTGAAWPPRAPLGLEVALRPPGGGRLQATGRVAIDPISADVRVTSKDVALAPYQAYVPVPARIAGQTDLDVAVVLLPSSEGRATVRGDAAFSRVDVRDGERTVLKAERAAATGVDIDWPRRVIVRDVKLAQPWILIERDREGALPLRTLLSPRSVRAAPGASTVPSPDRDASPEAQRASGVPPGSPPGAALPVTLHRVVIEDGGARIVDYKIAPPFALDFQRLAAKIDGLSTDAAAKPARLELTGRAGTTSLLALQGTVGSLAGPLRLDLSGDLRGFAMPRTNPYLINQVAWEAREGWLTTAIRCRIDGDALDARTEVQLSRLQVARAQGGADGAQARIGLPLGMIVALMKDTRGDIRMSLPVGGRLSDPRFDVSEVIWSTLRNVAVKAIAAPVSWIGRVEYTADSRIERIDIDPIPFAPGQAALTPETQEQVTRVAAFLGQAPTVRMALAPSVSARDRVALGQKAIDAAIERVARDGRISPDAAVARLFKEQFPDEAVPATPDAMRATLAERAATASEVADLAARRLETVRTGIKKAGVAGERLNDGGASKAPVGSEAQVKLDLLEPESPGSPERPGFFRRLLGEARSSASARRD